ncbi:hypothetical protein C8R43DRAFT_953345 [Mycena crocata]|nr:hypothetical protein C8R43DRAFT_953345 [Mycena crocata]
MPYARRCLDQRLCYCGTGHTKEQPPFMREAERIVRATARRSSRQLEWATMTAPIGAEVARKIAEGPPFVMTELKLREAAQSCMAKDCFVGKYRIKAKLVCSRTTRRNATAARVVFKPAIMVKLRGRASVSECASAEVSKNANRPASAAEAETIPEIYVLVRGSIAMSRVRRGTVVGRLSQYQRLPGR